MLQKFLTYFAMYNKLGVFLVIQRLYKGGSLVRFSAMLKWLVCSTVV